MEKRPEELGEPRGNSEEECSPERRKFLTRLCLGLGGGVALTVATPVLGFVVWPARRTQHVWRPVGRVEDFAPGETVKVLYQEPEVLPWAGATGQGAAYVRREPGARFVAFSVYCTHTACPVRWEQGARLFLCPCHGGAFHADGTVAAGPPPQPLPQHEVRVRDGQVELMTRPLPLKG